MQYRDRRASRSSDQRRLSARECTGTLSSGSAVSGTRCSLAGVIGRAPVLLSTGCRRSAGSASPPRAAIRRNSVGPIRSGRRHVATGRGRGASTKRDWVLACAARGTCRRYAMRRRDVVCCTAGGCGATLGLGAHSEVHSSRSAIASTPCHTEWSRDIVGVGGAAWRVLTGRASRSPSAETTTLRSRWVKCHRGVDAAGSSLGLSSRSSRWRYRLSRCRSAVPATALQCTAMRSTSSRPRWVQQPRQVVTT